MLWVNIELHIQYTHFWISIVHVSRLVDAHISKRHAIRFIIRNLTFQALTKWAIEQKKNLFLHSRIRHSELLAWLRHALFQPHHSLWGSFPCACVCVLAVATFNTCRSAYLFDMFEHQRSLRAVLSEPAVIQAQLFRIAFVIMWYRVRIESSSSQNIQTHRTIA